MKILIIILVINTVAVVGVSNALAIAIKYKK